MLTLIKSALLAALDQLATPWDWFAGLPLFDWQLPLLLMILAAIFYRQIIVQWVMAQYLIGDWIADQTYIREWNYYARMSPAEFRRVIEALDAKFKRDEEAAERLENRARQGVRIPGGAHSLYQEAQRRRAKSAKLLGEIERLKELRAEIEKQEAAQGGGAKRVVGIMNRLASRDPAEAEDALAELNQLGMAFDWDRLIPANVPDQARQVAIKTLRLMASTSNVNEAQTAYGRVLKMLESHGMTWRNMAA
jgi:hypothetical protein